MNRLRRHGETSSRWVLIAGVVLGALACRSRAGESAGASRTDVQPDSAHYHEEYQAVFARETADQAWAARAEEVARAKLGAVLPEGSRIRSVECRATLCRVETAHRDKSSYFTFGRRAFVSGDGRLWNAATFSVPADPAFSEPVMVSYVAREGYDLPRID
ncbi:MAG TPA: hypothetical protein VN962_19360 [Polyangia bacterium]|nr:hypothetical protein [Polyangia bacterium]